MPLRYNRKRTGNGKNTALMADPLRLPVFFKSAEHIEISRNEKYLTCIKNGTRFFCKNNFIRTQGSKY